MDKNDDYMGIFFLQPETEVMQFLLREKMRISAATKYIRDKRGVNSKQWGVIKTREHGSASWYGLTNPDNMTW